MIAAKVTKVLMSMKVKSYDFLDVKATDFEVDFKKFKQKMDLFHVRYQ